MRRDVVSPGSVGRSRRIILRLVVTGVVAGDLVRLDEDVMEDGVVDLAGSPFPTGAFRFTPSRPPY